MHRRYAVLYCDPEDISFLDIFRGALDVILENYDYYFMRSDFETVSDTLMRNIYIEQRHNIVASLVVDLRLQLQYLQVEANLAEEAEKVISWFKDLLPVAPLSELQETASNVMLDNPDSMIRLALGVNPSSDPESLRILREGMNVSDELVRFNAVEAVSLTQWPEFCVNLKHLKDDPCKEVQDIVSHAINACGCEELLKH